MNVVLRLTCCCLAAVLWATLTPCPPAWAQDADDPIMLDPVKVTAQKREQNLQDVPASVDVIDSDILNYAGIREMEDLYRYAPNVHHSGSYMEHNFVIRGVPKFTSSTDSNVVMYVDDVPLPLQMSHNVSLMDIERVEILRGPQGTLYGMNSEAGVINIVTKKPANEFGGKVFTEYASADTSRLGGMFNLPLVQDTLHLRLAGQREYTEGHITNVATDNDKAAEEEHGNFRAVLSWTPDSDWSLSLSGDYMKADDNQMTVHASEGPLAKAGFLESDYDCENDNEQEESGLNLTLKRKGQTADFLSVTGYRSFLSHTTQDWDVSSSLTYYQGEDFSIYEDHIASQEFRLASPEKSTDFQWILGLFGYVEELKIQCKDYTLLFSEDPWSEIYNRIDRRGAAVFGEGTYTVLDDLHLTAGLRVAYDELNGWRKSPTDMVELDETMDTLEYLPKAAIAYDITDQAMTYASVTRGFMNGGFQYYYYSPTPTADTFTYDPEYTWNYEIGLKTSWLENRLTANLAAFYIDITDKQIADWDPVTNTSKVINAAEAHSQGFELEVSAVPARGWTLMGGLGVIDSRIDELDLTDDYDYSDKRMPDVPSYTYNVGVQYNHDSGLFGRADLLGVGDFTGDTKNLSKEDGYQTVNLRLGWEWGMGSIYVWCNNVFDERYYESVYAWDMSGTDEDRQVVDGDPRTFGMGASLTF